MAGAAAPALWRFGRDGARIGAVRLAGPVTHREELGGEDAIAFRCRSAVGKYDRLLWRDPEDGRWREHVAVAVETAAGGALEVRAESSLCDLLGSYVEEERLSGASAAAALAACVAGTGWSVDAEGVGGTASCLLYHTNRLAALRRVAGLVGCELEPVIAVAGGAVASRTVRARTALGAWRGARIEAGRNAARLARAVLDDEVFTALYGWGAGLPVVGEDGAWTGGYRRKLSFAEANGGVAWVGDEAARQAWGLPDGRGGRRHRFGEVTFPECGDPEELLALTQAALGQASAPRTSWEADVAGALPVPIGLGDEVAAIDALRDPALRERARCVARTRELGDAVRARYVLGAGARTAYQALSEAGARAVAAEEAAGAAGDAAAAAGSRAAALEEAAGVGADGSVPALATKAYVDAAIAALEDLSEVEF